MHTPKIIVELFINLKIKVFIGYKIGSEKADITAPPHPIKNCSRVYEIAVIAGQYPQAPFMFMFGYMGITGFSSYSVKSVIY